MNITFIIGNGFDVALGLKTKYSDFYNYYKENDPHDLLSESINTNYELWADLELGLGGFLKNISKDQIEEFLNCKGRIESMLVNYLRTQESTFQIKGSMVELFRNNIISFIDKLPTQYEEHIKKVISSTSEDIIYQFITFNYTSTLDQFVTETKNKYKQFSTHICKNTGYNDKIATPIHVHGTLDSDMILGINDISQIKNTNLLKEQSLTDYILKPKLNSALGERIIDRTKRIIDNSKLICLYGVSIGETDKLWWNYIANWLAKSPDNRLVLYIYQDGLLSFSGQEKIRSRDKYRNVFINRARGTDNKSLNEIRDKIIVVHNSDIFDLNTKMKEPILVLN